MKAGIGTHVFHRNLPLIRAFPSNGYASRERAKRRSDRFKIVILILIGQIKIKIKIRSKIKIKIKIKIRSKSRIRSYAKYGSNFWR
jgi:hypothetical protein